MSFVSFSPQFGEFQEKFSAHFRPLQRSFQFWARTADIYAGYKVFQVRVNIVKDVKKKEEMWEKQHEFAADKIYDMCVHLGGFFLKVAQIIGKPDLAPAAWVRRLVTLCDQAPATSFDVVRLVLENELGRSVDDVFDIIDTVPLGSASIAQVHRAKLKGNKTDVVVKVQHPGVQELMMTDLRNLKAFALFMQKTDIKFDLYSITKEMEKQIAFEFDFPREAAAMDKIRRFLYENNKKSPVIVPRVMRDLISRKALVMEYIDGIPILKLGDEMAKRGFNPSGKIAAVAKQNILKSLTLAYGQMILKSGFFHADPHPGNILICKGSEVALLDYGQVKDLPENLRLGYANLVIAMADDDPARTIESFRELGIGTLIKCKDEREEMLKLAKGLFDSQLPPGVTALQPFSEESSVNKVSVEIFLQMQSYNRKVMVILKFLDDCTCSSVAFPEELFSVLRTVHLLRGLSVGMGVNHSCAEQWRPIAEEVLSQAGRPVAHGNPLTLSFCFVDSKSLTTGIYSEGCERNTQKTKLLQENISQAVTVNNVKNFSDFVRAFLSVVFAVVLGNQKELVLDLVTSFLLFTRKGKLDNRHGLDNVIVLLVNSVC